MALDDIDIRPVTKKPPSNFTSRRQGQSGSVLLTELRWDSEPGGIYDLYTSIDLIDWQYQQPYTANGTTQAITSITSLVTQPRFFYRVSRQQ